MLPPRMPMTCDICGVRIRKSDGHYCWDIEACLQRLMANVRAKEQEQREKRRGKDANHREG